MKMRKSLLLLGCVPAIVALLGATTAFAAAPTSCSTTNFAVNVAMETTNGISSYTYTMSNAPGSSKNANKFFVYSRRGLEGDLQGTIGGSPAGEYITNGEIGANNCPTSGAWTFNEHNDGWCFTSVAMGNQPSLTVSERINPEEGASSILLSYANTTESCGPILGPTTDAAPEFEGSPLATTTLHQTFADGCSYFVTVNKTTNMAISMTVDPATPIETVFDPLVGPKACQVIVQPGICEAETGLTYCPEIEAGRPPIQGEPGGYCYYPKNIKYTC